MVLDVCNVFGRPVLLLAWPSVVSVVVPLVSVVAIVALVVLAWPYLPNPLDHLELWDTILVIMTALAGWYAP